MLVCSSSRRRTGGCTGKARPGAVPLAAMANTVWQLRARGKVRVLEQRPRLLLFAGLSFALNSGVWTERPHSCESKCITFTAEILAFSISA